MIEKYISNTDGKVAVLVSHGTAGWSTWNEDYGGWMMFDAEIVKLTRLKRISSPKIASMKSMNGRMFAPVVPDT